MPAKNLKQINDEAKLLGYADADTVALGVDRMFVVDDGGREASGRKGDAGDCVVRAITLAGRMDYDFVYKALADASAAVTNPMINSKPGQRTARDGFSPSIAGPVLQSWGWTDHSIPRGTRIGVLGELPDVSSMVLGYGIRRPHWLAVADGVVRDTWDSRWTRHTCELASGSRVPALAQYMWLPPGVAAELRSDSMYAR